MRKKEEGRRRRRRGEEFLCEKGADENDLEKKRREKNYIYEWEEEEMVN